MVLDAPVKKLSDGVVALRVVVIEPSTGAYAALAAARP